MPHCFPSGLTPPPLPPSHSPPSLSLTLSHSLCFFQRERGGQCGPRAPGHATAARLRLSQAISGAHTQAIAAAAPTSTCKFCTHSTGTDDTTRPPPRRPPRRSPRPAAPHARARAHTLARARTHTPPPHTHASPPPTCVRIHTHTHERMHAHTRAHLLADRLDTLLVQQYRVGAVGLGPEGAVVLQPRLVEVCNDGALEGRAG